MEQEPLVITLRNFELAPQLCRIIKGSTVLLKVCDNRRGYSRVYDQPRPFMFVIQELDIETPPLLDHQEFSFKVDRLGTYSLQCVNYSKLSARLEVIDDTSSSSIKSSRSGSRESPTLGLVDNCNKEADKPTSTTMLFERYEDFANMLNTNFNRAQDIPEYLLSCFKHELSILQSTDELENPRKSQEVNVGEFKIQEDLQKEPDQIQQTDILEQDDIIPKQESQEAEPQEQSTTASTPSKTFKEQADRFLRGKRWTPDNRPSNRQYYRKLLTVLHNRFSLGSYFE